MASTWGLSWGTSWGTSWGRTVAQETPMYWGLLRKKKKKPEVEEQLTVAVETEELELAEAQSSMQLALQKALVRKQSERQLDQFIETLAQKAGREKLEKEQREDQEIAAIFAMLI